MLGLFFKKVYLVKSKIWPFFKRSLAFFSTSCWQPCVLHINIWHLPGCGDGQKNLTYSQRDAEFRLIHFRGAICTQAKRRKEEEDPAFYSRGPLELKKGTRKIVRFKLELRFKPKTNVFRLDALAKSAF